MPDEATPLQRAQLLATLSAGGEIIRLRHLVPHLHLGTRLNGALMDVAQGHSASAITRLAQLDAAVVARGDTQPEGQAILRARGSRPALSEALTRPPAYFDAGAPP